MNRFSSVAVCAVAGAMIASASASVAHADSTMPPSMPPSQTAYNSNPAQPNYISVSGGDFDILRTDKPTNAGDFRVDFSYAGFNLPWYLEPWGGVEVTTDSSVWAGGGFLFDIPIGYNFYAVPSFGVGYYGQGDGKNLGNDVEFRSQIEVAYKFENASRIGLAFSHTSNASLGKINPGVEVLSLYFHLPINFP